MDKNTIIINSNMTSKINNIADKKITNRVGSAGTLAIAFFVGATMLNGTSLESNYCKLSDGRYESSSIQYINLDMEKSFKALNICSVIDLLKIDNINKLNNMSNFDDNWNGTGGKRFSDKAISMFKNIIENVVKQPQIAPTGRNTLLMQYELEDNSKLVFELGEKRVEKVFIPQGNYTLAQNDIYFEDICYNINECVEQFYGCK